jgi:hypothetical protein
VKLRELPREELRLALRCLSKKQLVPLEPLHSRQRLKYHYSVKMVGMLRKVLDYQGQHPEPILRQTFL